jgi:hypothetical protein
MQGGGYQTGGFDPGLLALIATLLSGGIGGYGYTKYNEEAVNAAKDSLSPQQQQIIYEAQKAQKDAAATEARVKSEANAANARAKKAEDAFAELKSKCNALAARTAATSGPVVTYQKATPETLAKAVDPTIKALKKAFETTIGYEWMGPSSLPNLKSALEYPAIGPGRLSRPSLSSFYTNRVKPALERDAGLINGGGKRRYRRRMRGGEGEKIPTEEEFFRIYEQAINDVTISVAQAVADKTAEAKKTVDAKVATKAAEAKKADLEKKDKLARTALEKIASDLAKEYADAGKILTSAQSVLLTVSKDRRANVKDVADSLISLAAKVATVVPEGAGKTKTTDYAATDRGLKVLKDTFSVQAGGEEEEQEGGFSLFKKAETEELKEDAEFQDYKKLLLPQTEGEGSVDEAWQGAKSNLMALLPAFKAAVKAYDAAVKKAAKEEKEGLAFTPPKIWMPDMSAVSKLSQSNPFSAVLAAIQQSIENAKTDLERAKNARQAVSDTRTATKTGVDLMKAVVKNAEKALREIDDVLELKGIAAAKAKTGGGKAEYEAAKAKYDKENEEYDAAAKRGEPVGPPPQQPDPAAFDVPVAPKEEDGGSGDRVDTAAAGDSNEEEDGGSGDGTPAAASEGTEGTESSNPPDVPPASTEECAAVTKLVPKGDPEESLRWFAAQLRAILYGKKEMAGRGEAAVASADGTTWVPRDLNDDERNALFPPGPAEPAERTSSVLDREGKPFTLISMKYVLDKLNTGPFGGVADYLRATFGKEPTDTYLYAAVAGEGYVVLRCYLTALKPILVDYTAQYSRFGLARTSLALSRGTRKAKNVVSDAAMGTLKASNTVLAGIAYILGILLGPFKTVWDKGRAAYRTRAEAAATKAKEDAAKAKEELAADKAVIIPLVEAWMSKDPSRKSIGDGLLEVLKNDDATSKEVQKVIADFTKAEAAAAAAAAAEAEPSEVSQKLGDWLRSWWTKKEADDEVAEEEARVNEAASPAKAEAVKASISAQFKAAIKQLEARRERATDAAVYAEVVRKTIKQLKTIQQQIVTIEGSTVLFNLNSDEDSQLILSMNPDASVVYPEALFSGDLANLALPRDLEPLRTAEGREKAVTAVRHLRRAKKTLADLMESETYSQYTEIPSVLSGQALKYSRVFNDAKTEALSRQTILIERYGADIVRTVNDLKAAHERLVSFFPALRSMKFEDTAPLPNVEAAFQSRADRAAEKEREKKDREAAAQTAKQEKADAAKKASSDKASQAATTREVQALKEIDDLQAKEKVTDREFRSALTSNILLRNASRRAAGLNEDSLNSLTELIKASKETIVGLQADRKRKGITTEERIGIDKSIEAAKTKLKKEEDTLAASKESRVKDTFGLAVDLSKEAIEDARKKKAEVDATANAAIVEQNKAKTAAAAAKLAKDQQATTEANNKKAAKDAKAAAKKATLEKQPSSFTVPNPGIAAAADKEVEMTAIPPATAVVPNTGEGTGISQDVASAARLGELKPEVAKVFYTNFIGPIKEQLTTGQAQESTVHVILESIRKKWADVPDKKAAKGTPMFQAVRDWLKLIVTPQAGGGDDPGAIDLAEDNRTLASKLLAALEEEPAGGRRKSRKSTLKTRRGGKQNVRGSRRRKNRANRSHSHSR